jgi:hypothetical protein
MPPDSCGIVPVFCVCAGLRSLTPSIILPLAPLLSPPTSLRFAISFNNEPALLSWLLTILMWPYPAFPLEIRLNRPFARLHKKCASCASCFVVLRYASLCFANVLRCASLKSSV